MGVSENRGPYYGTLNSRILIIRTPNKVPLSSGVRAFRVKGFRALGFRVAGLRINGSEFLF